jgi:predicted transcriptional regulator of viral defense system
MQFVPVLAPASVDHHIGTSIVPHAGGQIRVTTLERTMVDALDAPDHCGGWEEIWRSLELIEFFELDAVIDYALALGSALTIARVGFFLEQHRDSLMVEDRHLAILRANSPAQPRYFDSTRQQGTLFPAWNLIVPARILERHWEEAG